MFLFLLPSVLAGAVSPMPVSKSTVLVCYGRLNPADIKGYNYVILESQFYNIYELRKIKSQNGKVLAYISIGEVNANAPHYAKLKGLTVGKNEIWNSYYLDLDSEKTRKVLMDIIKSKIDMGYDGFFLDNVDHYTSFGVQPRQKATLVAFLQEIFNTYPEQTFLQNAGLELVPDTAPYVDAVIIESIATDYTFADKKYKMRDQAQFDHYVVRLNEIRDRYKLPVILIEYADTPALRDEVVKRIKPLKFEYFIGKIDLQTIPDYHNK